MPTTPAEDRSQWNRNQNRN